MWTAVIPASALTAADRWTVEFFAALPVAHGSPHPRFAIGEVADERRTTVDPRTMADATIDYLELENVRSLTGELTGFRPVPAATIRSRSKTFGPGDVLYESLRPELNKVYLADGEVASGICSGEFIVLRPRPGRVRGRCLRHLLASPYVTGHAARLRTGAALPRMATADLLALQVPVPPLDVQDRLCAGLAQLDARVRALRAELDRLPGATADAFTRALETGAAELDVDAPDN